MYRKKPIGRNVGNFLPPYQEPFVPLSQCPNQRNKVNVEGLRIGEYPWSRRLFVVVKENGQLDQTAGETYATLLLTDQGQELIRNAGFVSLR